MQILSKSARSTRILRPVRFAVPSTAMLHMEASINARLDLSQECGKSANDAVEWTVNLWNNEQRLTITSRLFGAVHC